MMSYRETAWEFTRGEQGFPTPNLRMSGWAEARREVMTPLAIAQNHALHVSDTAAKLRDALNAPRTPGPAQHAAEVFAAARALLEAIGEADDFPHGHPEIDPSHEPRWISTPNAVVCERCGYRATTQQEVDGHGKPKDEPSNAVVGIAMNAAAMHYAEQGITIEPDSTDFQAMRAALSAAEGTK